MLYGGIFMLGAAYTLPKGGHIRTDMFYRLYSPRWQGIVDGSLYILFFFPGLILFFIAGIEYAARSWVIQETASMSPWRPIIYPFKTVIPVSILMLLIQGVSELFKCIHASVSGGWP
jgi:TRAP-type mannitol/chloroaromatic compound transport system permease small subunit